MWIGCRRWRRSARACASEPQRHAEVDALEALVALVVEHAPRVLVIDDLRVGRSPTVAAIGYLQRRCRDVPAMLLGGFGRCDVRDQPLRLLQPNVRLRLEPLSSTT
jgi:hypothetical protein